MNEVFLFEPDGLQVGDGRDHEDARSCADESCDASDQRPQALLKASADREAEGRKASERVEHKRDSEKAGPIVRVFSRHESRSRPGSQTHAQQHRP